MTASQIGETHQVHHFNAHIFSVRRALKGQEFSLARSPSVTRHDTMKPFFVVAGLLSLLVSSWSVEGTGFLYQLVVYADNAPADALDRVSANATLLLSKFLSHEPGYQSLSPGQYMPSRVRHLEGGRSDTIDAEGGGDIATSGGTLRGMDRNLQAGSQCPPSCARSGSTYCRNIGCAYCGSSCSRRLQAAVSKYGAREVEDSMNDDLVPYCNNQTDCSLIFKILRVRSDGSTTPIV